MTKDFIEETTFDFEQMKNQLYFLKYDDDDDFGKTLKILLDSALLAQRTEMLSRLPEEMTDPNIESGEYRWGFNAALSAVKEILLAEIKK